MKKLTLIEVKARIEELRPDVEISVESYRGWKQTCLFYDKVEKDWFESTPCRVVTKGVMHPRRSVEQRKKTNLERYGTECSIASNSVREKAKKTLLKKYGVTHPLKSDSILEKRKETVRERYGVDCVTQSSKVKSKTKETLKVKYGVEHPMELKSVRDKIHETVLKKYGVNHHSQAQSVKDKKESTMMERHGVRSPFQLPKAVILSRETMMERHGASTFWESKKIHVDNGEYLCDIWKKASAPKPSYSNLINQLKCLGYTGTVPLQEVEAVLDSYKSSKSSLEVLTEKILGVATYNRGVPGHTHMHKPDFKISDSLFVNVDGLYWHSSARKQDKWYHFNLRTKFEENNTRIVQFREDEITLKPSIVQSMIAHCSNSTTKCIGARKCLVNDIAQAQAEQFLLDNHIMGTTSARHVGLADSSQNLLSIMSYRVHGNTIKIERFCSKVGHNVQGGFSKLLSHVVANSPACTEVQSWVDLRYGNGHSLVGNGFIEARTTLGWKWTDGTRTFNRRRCRANMDSRRLSEKEHAAELGWCKIYDAGQRLFVKSIASKTASI